MTAHVANPSEGVRSASEQIKKRKDEIIKTWQERIRKAIPAAKGQTKFHLRNSIPKFLDCLERALSSNRPWPEVVERLYDVCEDHGEQRSNLEGYSLGQVLKEYQILQETILSVLEQERPVTALERDIILTTIAEGMIEAGSRYIEWAQQNTRAIETRYRLVVDGVKDHAIMRTDLEGNILDWNSGAENIFQYKRPEIVGRNARILFTPNDLANGTDKWEMTAALETGRAEDVRWHVKKDGSWIFGDGIMNPLRDASGRAFGFVKVLRDQTLQKEVQDHLAEQKAKFQTIFNFAPDGIILADPSRTIVACNPAALRTLGYAPEELIGNPTSVFYADPKDFEEQGRLRYNPASEAQGARSYFARYRRKDGEMIISETTSAILRNASGEVLGYLAILRDVTDRVTAEKALRESEARIRVFVEAMPQMAFISDADGRSLFLNRRHYEYFGLSPGSLEAWREKEKEVRHPDDLTRVLETWRESTRTGKPFEVEYRLKRRDGAWRWHLGRAMPLHDGDGRIINWLGTNTDIHEQKLLQEQLLEATQKAEQERAKFEAAFQSVAEGIFIVDQDGNPVFVNEAGVKTLGFSSAVELMRKLEFFIGIFELRDLNGQLIPVADWPLNRALRGESFRNWELNVYRRDTGQKWVWSYSGEPAIERGRNLRLGVVVVRDITDQVAARRALEESEQRFRQIANALPQIIWTATSEFSVDWYNDWWFKYLGVPRGARWDDLDARFMHPDDVERTRAQVKEAVETGRDFVMEQRFRRGSNGQYRWHLVHGVPIKDSSGNVVKWIGANTDIHDHKLLVQKLEEERELRERFVATLSHDLRTPLTAAKMSAQLLARRASDPDAVLKAAGRIAENMDRADQMIRDLLDANRIRAGEKLPLEIAKCEITRIAESTIEELASLHGDRFVLDSPEVIEGYSSCNGIRRMIENLCSNAVKYGAVDRPVIVALRRDTDRIEISVRNFGPPIAPQDLKDLFKPFRRSASAQRGGQKGWGLGLTLVKGIAEALGGDVRVESGSMRGTIFTVTLPRDARNRSESCENRSCSNEKLS